MLSYLEHHDRLPTGDDNVIIQSYVYRLLYHFDRVFTVLEISRSKKAVN